MITDSIGTITLNISFILYLIVYLPQIFHNYRRNRLYDLSLGLHFSLYFAYGTDAIYGMLHNLQWQYKTVSFVGLTLLSLQHLQLTRFFWKNQQRYRAINFSIIMLLILSLIVIALNSTATNTQLIGYVSRFFFLIYLIPQLFKNHQNTIHTSQKSRLGLGATITNKSASPLSLTYLHLSLIISLLDCASAWCFDWGWPNKLAAPLTIILLITAILQSKQSNLN